MLGFTGTSKRKLTNEQLVSLERIVRQYVADGGTRTALHGGCRNADREFHTLTAALGFTHEVLPGDTEQEQWGLAHAAVTYRPPVAVSLDPHIYRNRTIVNRAGVMIACPRLNREELRSGTWATIRYARKRCKPLHIVWPDGTIERENL